MEAAGTGVTELSDWQIGRLGRCSSAARYGRFSEFIQMSPRRRSWQIAPAVWRGCSRSWRDSRRFSNRATIGRGRRVLAALLSPLVHPSSAAAKRSIAATSSIASSERRADRFQTSALGRERQRSPHPAVIESLRAHAGGAARDASRLARALRDDAAFVDRARATKPGRFARELAFVCISQTERRGASTANISSFVFITRDVYCGAGRGRSASSASARTQWDDSRETAFCS